MKRIYYIATGLLMMVMISCNQDQLRMDERQQSFDVNYFTYSRFQLTAAIVDLARYSGIEVISDEFVNYSTLYSFDCYTGEKFAEVNNANEEDWSMNGLNPYTSSMRQLNAVIDLATKEGNMANVGAAEILKCMVGGFLTEKYGDIPFSEASIGRSGNIFPKFDAQKDVYLQMFALLDDAVKILSASDSQGLPAEQDPLFAGDRTKWIKMANSLKFRLMVHSYEAFKKAGTDLGPQMQTIASSGQYMSTTADNASLPFAGTQASNSWYYTNAFGGTGNDLTEQKPTKYLIDILTSFDDPRMYVIFAPALSPVSASATEYTETVKINNYDYTITHYPSSLYDPADIIATGRNAQGVAVDVPYPLDAKWVGCPNPLRPELQYAALGLAGTNYPYDNRRFTSFSKLLNETKGPALKNVVMESSEMMFLLAEARQKSWISAGSVDTYYKDGIRLSFDRWQIENGTKPPSHIGSTKIIENYNDYYNKAGVKLDGSAGDLDKIALQKWLSMLVVNPTEAFTDYRRTGKPEFLGKITTSFSPYTYPYRNKYPNNEYNNNRANYDLAVAALGGKDLPDQKMWLFK